MGDSGTHHRKTSGSKTRDWEGSDVLVAPPVNIDQPRWDQRLFVGRLQHFARITNPLLLLKWRDLDHAAKVVKMARYA